MLSLLNSLDVVMPNPNQGVFQVHILDGLQGTFYWEMVDLTGRIILFGQTKQSCFGVESTQLNAGIYFVNLIEEKSGFVHGFKVIKQ